MNYRSAKAAGIGYLLVGENLIGVITCDITVKRRRTEMGPVCDPGGGEGI